ncbi:uncharacterized protein TNCV_970011 [Trichonephila clavipes]|nr:uncharacterized protein TNCV_970011 [Trichonephila clavipes]
MEQSNKNTTNADTLTSERERNLSKENRETQRANINDENMQDLDDQQPSEKDIVQPEDISNAPAEKCLENFGSSDLNPIENLREVLEQGVKGHRTAPTNLIELWTVLANIWQVILVEPFQKLVKCYTSSCDGRYQSQRRLNTLLGRFFADISINLMSSSESKLEQDSSPPTNSFSESLRNKLANSSWLSPST